jgi:hypothetical protein
VLDELWACLEQGVCPALQELDLGEVHTRGAVAARCLRQGLPGCPDLRHLRLQLQGESAVVALAEALEQGLYPKLEVLRVFSPSVNGGNIVAAGLQAFPRPGLCELNLHVASFGAGLIEALQSGACRGLTRLSLEASSFDQGVSMGELGAAFGTCSHLQRLFMEIRQDADGDSFYRSLAEAVHDGDLPCLEQLSLFFNKGFGEVSAKALAEALGTRAASGRPVRFEDFATRE